MQTLRNPELYPVVIIGILTLIGFIVFWSVMDMVLPRALSPAVVGGSNYRHHDPVFGRLPFRPSPPPFDSAAPSGAIRAARSASSSYEVRSR